MVRARLHIICGNCGCNDEFNFTTSQELITDDDDKTELKVRLHCNNCSTIHCLEENMKSLTMNNTGD